MDSISPDLQRFLDDAEEAHVVVVGDLMLDRYLWGDVERVSPEAPVPVVHLQRTSSRAGGAANVAMNLAGLGIATTLIGCVGNDDAAERLGELLKDKGLETDYLISASGRPTTTKTRVVGNRQQMLRLDEEYAHPVDDVTISEIVEAVQASLDKADAIILSDYAKGVLTSEACAQIIEDASEADCPIFVDPKGTDYRKYAGATTITPNNRELALATGRSGECMDSILEEAQDLRKELEIENFIVTRGENGITRLSGDETQHYPAVAKEVFDVSGAGDTVTATLAAGRAAEMGIESTIRLANLAAGAVITKVGTVAITRDALASAVRDERFTTKRDKIFDRNRIQTQVETWKSRAETIVFTNGCFDILHVGHVTYLEEAKKEGDRLVVGLNTDRSVRALKGEPRPIVSEEQRARVLASLESVDAVVLFDENTPRALIDEVRPDVLVKGAGYEKSEVVGASAVERWGGRVELIPLVDGVSTTNIIDSIQKINTH